MAYEVRGAHPPPVMIANAGIGPPVDFLDTTTKTMNDIWEINIRGVMYCYQAAARQMIKQGGGGRLIGEWWWWTDNAKVGWA